MDTILRAEFPDLEKEGPGGKIFIKVNILTAFNHPDIVHKKRALDHSFHFVLNSLS